MPSPLTPFPPVVWASLTATPSRCCNAENQQIKIRLYGIDSPESGQPHGRKAKQNMSALVFGQNVEIESIDQDRYGRTVARVSDGGLNVCAEQLRAGYAWVFPRYY